MNLNATLLGQMTTFGLFVWFTMKYIWPPVIKAMQERQQKIADGLGAAERGVHALELSKKESAHLLQQAKEEAASVVERANQRSVRLVEEAKKLGRDESERLVAQGHADVETILVQTKAALREEAVNIAIAGIQKVYGAKITKTTHDHLLNELIEQV